GRWRGHASQGRQARPHDERGGGGSRGQRLGQIDGGASRGGVEGALGDVLAGGELEDTRSCGRWSRRTPLVAAGSTMTGSRPEAKENCRNWPEHSACGPIGVWPLSHSRLRDITPLFSWAYAFRTCHSPLAPF